MAFRRQSFHRQSFPNGVVAFDVVQRRWIQYEEASIDEATFRLRLFFERLNPIAVKGDAPKPGRGSNARNRCSQSMRLVKRYFCSNINIRKSVSISHAKGLIWIQIGSDSFQTAASHGMLACIDQRYPPRFTSIIMVVYSAISVIKSYI